MIHSYRPSGPLRWVIERLPSRHKWDFIGAIAAEDRANSVALELDSMRKLGKSQFLRIADEPSEFEARTRKACDDNLAVLTKLLSEEPCVCDTELFSDIDELEELFVEVQKLIGGDVVLDITSLPKRFFFHLVRRLRSSTSVRNLLVTYTLPQGYGKKIHKNPGGWMPLPGFGSEDSSSGMPMLVIAVGYHYLKLLELIRDQTPQPVRLLMPFPSMPPGFAQNWEFVRYIREQGVEFAPRDIRRVDPFSLSLAFDHILAQCAGHETELILAPFGPKPISLAMALYALAREEAGLPVTVGYTQPMAYSPDYSHGVRRGHDGKPVVHTYCVKLDGNLLFEL